MPVLASEVDPSPTGGLVAGPVSALVRARALSEGGRAYIEHARENRSLSFRDLDQAVDGWASRLHECGVDVGSTVGLVIKDPIDFAVAFLGTMASGCWAAPLDPSMPAHGTGGLVAALERVGADVVCADVGVPDGVDIDWVDIASATWRAHTGVHTARAPAGERGASGGAVLASSGTTGAPKVIPLHQEQLLHTARSVVGHHRLTPDDRGFNSLPLFHINAEVVGLLSTLVAGATLVLDDRFHRTRFWELMRERQITWINAVPAIISRLADPGVDEPIPPRIRFIRSASAPLPVATSARFEANTGIPVLETYGMTEAASQITANPLAGPRKPGSVGLPVGVDLRIVAEETARADGRLRQVEGDKVGHVEIRGPSVIVAYEGNNHADRVDADGWLRTGDLGHFDGDGYLYLDARTDDVINRGGEKVFPREIEEMVLVDPAVAAVAVVAAPDPELGQVPVAFVVLHGVDGVTEKAVAEDALARIRDRLAAALVKSKRPTSFSVVHALPAGATGKVQRRTLRESDLAVIARLDCR
jgi:acyl-CoA synthetase (AMP-forming)/AMP-acid ligase II